MNITAIVLTIQKQLIENPYDIAHDITHHYRVYENCVKIIEEEKLKPDFSALVISAWSHDLGGRSGENEGIIKNILQNYECDKVFVKKVLTIIQHHSYGTSQSSLEDKILFDADKLEYVNTFRLRQFIQASKDGFLNEQKYQSYKKEWDERKNKINSLLYFDFSKKLFEELLPQALRIMQ